jgi:hypothetical protein
MKQHLEEEAELRKYLLGELSLEEQVSVEARLFLDDEYLSQLKAVEDELIDAYAYEDLAADERAKVEARLLSRPGRREDLSIARALKRHVSDDDPVTPPVAPAPTDIHPTAGAESVSGPDVPSPPRKKDPFLFLSSLFARRPAVAYAFAAAALVILSAIIWFSMQSLRGRSSDLKAHEPTPQPSKPNEPLQPGGELQANQHPPGKGGDAPQREEQTRNDSAHRGKEERAQRREEPHNENAPTPQPATPRVATFLILPGGGVRGPGGAKKVTLSSDTRVVVLRLPVILTGDYQRFRATLQDDRRVIYTRADLKPEVKVDAELGKVVAFEVPTRLLHTRRYEIKLRGVTADGQTREVTTYTVPVERR